MEQKKKSAARVLIIAVVFMLVSMVGASLVQTGGGSVTVKDIRFETASGVRMSGLLFVPKGVSAENPAPAIVTSHGMFNNREMQDLNFVELSRRGYVVFSMDMISHGNSEGTDNMGGIVVGMYEAVKMLHTLDYVDAAKVGITGHSLGGMSSNVAVSIDNAMPAPLISAVLLNCADASYTDEEGGYINAYGSRDVGIIAAQYDEFFMIDADQNGRATPPRDYVKNKNAQSFLYFGADPGDRELRAPEAMYREEIDGQETIRVIYNPDIIHPWSHFSQRSTTATIQFFESALGAPNPIDASSQIWQWKVVFNLLGLVGFAMFLVSFVVLMVHTAFFAPLRATEPAAPATLEKSGKPWFWGSLAAGALFGALTYFPVLKLADSFTVAKSTFAQTPVWGICLWSMLCGLFAVLCMVVSYRLHGKKSGFSLTGRGVVLSRQALLRTVLLALIAVTVTYGWVFLADYFFKTDFRFWVLGIKAFTADKLLTAAFPYALFFLVYYIANSVAVNCFNYNSLGGRSWVNTLVVALFNMIPPAVLLILQYSAFRTTGFLLLTTMEPFSAEPYNMFTVWLFPVLVFLPVTAVISRKIYRVTNNPYLAGLINGLMVTIISCSNTLTWV